MVSVRTRMMRGSRALTRATNMAAMKPASKMALRMKKLPARKAPERNPDRAKVAALQKNTPAPVPP